MLTTTIAANSYDVALENVNILVPALLASDVAIYRQQGRKLLERNTQVFGDERPNGSVKVHRIIVLSHVD